jgi:hypothetical protein
MIAWFDRLTKRGRTGIYLSFFGYVFIAQASVAMSAIIDNTETINNADKAAPVLIFGLTSSAWDKTLIASLIIAAIAAIAVGFSTAASIIAHQQETLASEASLDRYKEEAAGRIAEARTAGIEAGKEAGNALLKAGEANKEAARAHQRAVETELALEQERVQRLRLEHMVQNRRLTDDQCTAIVGSLVSSKFKTDIWITTVRTDSEALFYANSIVECIKKTGINVSGPFTTWERAIGISLLQNDNYDVTPVAAALKEGGVDFTYDQEIKRGDWVEIVVGSRYLFPGNQ